MNQTSARPVVGTIEVWAPNARRLELVVGNRRTPFMEQRPGVWQANRPLEHGVDYQLALDGELLPDSRSAWQPAGVDGPSRFVDHSRFPWRLPIWKFTPLSNAILYEVHIGTFTPHGTFEAAIDRLDQLVRLGVTHLEIMPVAEFFGDRGWGYDGVFPFAPHHSYGGPDGLKTLVDACHERGLGVVLDVVYNHLGPRGNVLPKFGPYFTDRYQTPWGKAMNLDGPHSDEVRRYWIDNALMWLRDYRCDGLRIDAVHAIYDQSAVHFLEELAVEVSRFKRQLGRDMFLIAESDLNDPRVVRTWDRGGFGLDAQWSDDIHHAVHAALTHDRHGYYRDFGEFAHLAAAMTSPYVYTGNYSPHRQRRHGRPPHDLPAERFVAYLQNHDQLGNRALGERVTHLVSTNRAKVGAALILMSPYVPLLFQGEEWGATSPFLYFVDFHDDPELAAAVAKGRRNEFAEFFSADTTIPDPNEPETFERSKLNWEERSQAASQDMLDWYRRLIALRQESFFLRSRAETTQARFDEAEQWLYLQRGPLLMACNLSSERRTIPCEHESGAETILSSVDGIELGRSALQLPAESVVIARLIQDADSTTLRRKAR